MSRMRVTVLLMIMIAVAETVAHPFESKHRPAADIYILGWKEGETDSASTQTVPSNFLSELLKRTWYSDRSFVARQTRKFPEVDSRGFHEDIFDEGFGSWSPMKRF